MRLSSRRRLGRSRCGVRSGPASKLDHVVLGLADDVIAPHLHDRSAPRGHGRAVVLTQHLLPIRWLRQSSDNSNSTWARFEHQTRNELLKPWTAASAPSLHTSGGIAIALSGRIGDHRAHVRVLAARLTLGIEHAAVFFAGLHAFGRNRRSLYRTKFRPMSHATLHLTAARSGW